MTGSRTQEDGFTLIEIIIVLALSGMILSLLYGGIRFSGAVTNVVQTRAAAGHERDAARRVIRRLLEGAQSVRTAHGTVRFEGASNRVRFVGPPPANRNRGDRFELILERDDGALMLRWRPYAPGSAETGGPDWRSRALMTNVTALSFRYFAAEAAGDKAIWRSVWRDRKSRPVLVETTIIREAEKNVIFTRLRIKPPSGR